MKGRRVRAVAGVRALAAAAEVSRVHDLLGDARDRRGVLRRAARRDDQRDRQRSKLIDELTIAMNNARQAAITKELLEIVAGAEA